MYCRKYCCVEILAIDVRAEFAPTFQFPQFLHLSGAKICPPSQFFVLFGPSLFGLRAQNARAFLESSTKVHHGFCFVSLRWKSSCFCRYTVYMLFLKPYFSVCLLILLASLVTSQFYSHSQKFFLSEN